VWKYVFGVSTSAGQTLTQLSGKLDVCIEAAAVLLAMVRTLLNMVITTLVLTAIPTAVCGLVLLCAGNRQQFPDEPASVGWPAAP